MFRYFFWSVIIVVSSESCFSQSDKSYQLKVEYSKKGTGKQKVPKSDSLSLTFLYDYANDLIEIKTSEKSFTSDTLKADNLYGIGGFMRIAKSDLKKPFQIFFNGSYVGSLRLNQRFSSAHLEFDKKKRMFIWRYHKYKFAFV